MKLAFSLVPFFAICGAVAQDTRQVSEPALPPACATLPARLPAQGSTLSEADENKPDTARIQQALDGCAPGRAVELKADGARNAFPAGPLQLRRGVTLLWMRERFYSPPGIRGITTAGPAVAASSTRAGAAASP